MQARPALFDLYGDYLRSRSGRAPVAALVKLLAPLGIAAPAVRTAVSRMVRQGWLHPIRLAAGPGYQITARTARRLDDASARMHRTGRTAWDGRFDLILTHRPLGVRQTRRLHLLGYGRLGEHAWVAARPADDLAFLAGTAYDRFSAAHAAGAAEVVGRAWDLSRIAAGYQDFVTAQRPLVGAVTVRSTDEEAYAVRVGLVHAWRTTVGADPHLPAALLPAPWPGAGAASFFDRHAARLRPAADRFVERCLGAPGGGRVGFSNS